ncbi:MAG: competence protein CoiA family protein [Bacteroidota bacterium]|nr:competence protein CoiA family protein [Bacteroidota bacterium]MDP3145067.1 competence protein CoiA family protein [Bacteroidota bacterium]MDP3556099.1 competence protein CoiA family protein [Bacteroidota bacterium]
MQYAKIDGLRCTAQPKLKAICEHCNGIVQAKCGSKIVWHWAHVAAENCDNWYEPETQWHRDWKNNFGQDCSEISIVKDGIKHIADVLTKENLVIEFQNSNISSETIMERELFYDKMIWVINGVHFKENFTIWDKEFAENWQLKIEIIQNLKLSNSQPGARVLTVQGNQIRHEAIKKILNKHKFIYSRQRDVYTYDLNSMYNSHVLEARIQANILELYNSQKIDQKLKSIIYSWTRARKSWQDAKKPVFIDFNEGYLIWIKTNIGYNRGEGTKVSKKDFLAKYNITE